MTTSEQSPYAAPNSPIGTDSTQGMTKCIACSKEIPKIAGVCMSCGVSQRARQYRNKNVAGALAMVFGAFGVHRFYMGQWWGVLYLLTFWTLIPSIVSFVEAIVFWCSDLKKWDDKYNESKPAGVTEKSGGALVVLIVVMIFGGIAVIGILAAIALPAYHDYTIRAKVNQAILETRVHQTAIVDYYNRNEQLPSSWGEIDIDGEELDSGNIAELSDSGYVISYVGSEMALAQSKTIEFQAYLDDNEQIAWDCTGGSLSARHRPSMCRDQSDYDY